MRVALGTVYVDLIEDVTAAVGVPLLIANTVPNDDATDIPAADNLGSSLIQLSVLDSSANGLEPGTVAGTGSRTQIWVTTESSRELVYNGLSVGGGFGFQGAWATSSRFDAIQHNFPAGPYDEYRFALIRDTAFTSEDLVKVEIATSNKDGDSANRTFSFTIEDLTAPQLLQARTRGHTNLRLLFDEGMEQGTGVDGDALRVRDISGGVEIRPREGGSPPRIIAADTFFEATDVGLFVGIAGADNALNNDIFKIVSFIDTKTVEIDNELVVAEVLPLEQLVTVSPYRVDGVPDARRVIPYFNPIVIGAVSVEGTAAEIELLLHTDITQNREYTCYAVNVNDDSGNALPDSSVTFTSEPCNIPEGRVDGKYNYIDFIPEENLREDATGDLERFLRCLDEVLQLLLCDIDRFPEILDIELARLNHLEALLVHLGVPFSFIADLSETDKRRVASVLVDAYKRKGIEIGMESLISFVLGIQVDIRPYLGLASWTLGVSELGVDTALGPGTSFLRYSFEAVTDEDLTELQRRRMIELIEYMKPAHTHLIRVIEPGTAGVPAVTWQLGVSELGVDTVLA
jgi:phage tail-like protein